MRSKGMFISEHQRTFEWLGVVDYLAYRVTDGMVDDQKYKEFVPEIRKSPRRIAVHNFRNHKPWKDQAEHFLDSLICDPHCIAGDYEDTYTPMTPQSAAGYEKFLWYCRAQTGLPVVSYSNASTIANHLNVYTDITEDFGLWIVRFAPSAADINTALPNLIYNQKLFAYDWLYWQFGWRGNGEYYGVGSENVCLDVFNGTNDEHDIFLGIEAAPPPPVDLEKLKHDLDVLKNLYQEINLDLELAEQTIKRNDMTILNLKSTAKELRTEDNNIRRMVRDEHRKLEKRIMELEKNTHKHWWMRK